MKRRGVVQGIHRRSQGGEFQIWEICKRNANLTIKKVSQSRRQHPSLFRTTSQSTFTLHSPLLCKISIWVHASSAITMDKLCSTQCDLVLFIRLPSSSFTVCAWQLLWLEVPFNIWHCRTSCAKISSGSNLSVCQTRTFASVCTEGIYWAMMCNAGDPRNLSSLVCSSCLWLGLVLECSNTRRRALSKIRKLSNSLLIGSAIVTVYGSNCSCTRLARKYEAKSKSSNCLWYIMTDESGTHCRLNDIVRWCRVQADLKRCHWAPP